jgi:hypothetical protein
MRRPESAPRAQIRVVDYSATRAKAIAWLGDRYLLARPINRRFDNGRREPGHLCGPLADR